MKKFVAVVLFHMFAAAAPPLVKTVKPIPTLGRDHRVLAGFAHISASFHTPADASGRAHIALDL